MDAQDDGTVPSLAAPARAHHHVVDLAPLGSAAVAAQGPTQAEQDRAECKHFAKLAAQAALAGCALYELAGGGYLLCRWGMTKELPDLRAVAALLVRMGGAHA